MLDRHASDLCVNFGGANFSGIWSDFPRGVVSDGKEEPRLLKEYQRQRDEQNRSDHYD